MKMKLGLAQKIGAGYVAILAIILITGITVFVVLRKGRSIDNQVSRVNIPTLDAFKELRQAVKQSAKLTNDWIYQPSQAGKAELNAIHNEKYNALKSTIDKLRPEWANENITTLYLAISEKTTDLLSSEKVVMDMLATAEAYDNSDIIEKAMALTDGSITQTSAEIDAAFLKLIDAQEKNSDELLASKFASFDMVEWVIMVLSVSCLVVGVFSARYAMKSVKNPVGNLKATLDKLSLGVLPEASTKNDNDEIGGLLNGLVDGLRKTTLFANEIGKGNLDADYQALSEGDILGNSLITMRNNLKNSAEDDKRRNWATQGLAEIGTILRAQNTDASELYNNIIKFVVKYTKSNQGSLFLMSEGNDKIGFLELSACYAWDKKKFLQKQIAIGEGLTGQCAIEQSTIYMTKIPANYIAITSGLGAALPNALLIVPLKINDEIHGVLEIAGFNEYAPYVREFVEKLAETIAATISTVRVNERTKELLAQTQQQAEEMRAQEEEMRQNMEEMQATQEEMERKSIELNRTSAEMKGVVAGINATMATIEFLPDGTIVEANENFLSTMKYSLGAIKGMHHRMFVPKDIREADDYKTFWARLASGKSNSGTFRRTDSLGNTVWLNAIYNPIFNANGEVVKVVKFATDITKQQEMLVESKGVMNAINTTMATIEFTPEGQILDANENFLSTVKYPLDKIKGKHHKMFVPKEILESEDYKTFWTRLNEGKSIAGVFKRITSTGEAVWLNAIYNPMFNATGDVIKVIKFATDITREKEKETEAQQLLEETRAQEEELRQSMEEMQATQEEIQRRSDEVSAAHVEMAGILDGINATMATIEFTPDGRIVKANENFHRTMKSSQSKIEGQHHRMFVPEDVLNSVEYLSFWSSLANGQAKKGLFKRIALNGDVVWLDAIYTPIKNAKGDVAKVIKFANDVTLMQETLSKQKVSKEVKVLGV